MLRHSLKNYIAPLLTALPIALSASVGGGLPGDIFVSWGPSGRSLAMAGAMTGLADEASAVYFNPAGLVQIEMHELTLMHSIMFAGSDLSMEAINYALPTSEIGSFGFLLLAMHSGKIDYYPAGVPQPSGTFTYTNIAPMLTYARDIWDWLSMGISYKILYEVMANESGLGQGFDLGLLLFPSGKFSFGISGQNLLGPSWTLDSRPQSAPMSARIGLSMRPYLNTFTICGDVLVSEYKDPLFRLGIEYRPFYSMAVRGGIDQYVLTYGIGIKKDMDRYTLNIDYSGAYHYESASLLSPAHNISISFEFGGYRVRAHTPRVMFSPKSESEDNLAWLVLEANVRGEVKKWEVLIKDKYGTTVRRMGAYGPPPYRIAWDGKDDNGIFVEDGDYNFQYRVFEEKTDRVYECENAFVTLKTIGPKGTIIMTPMGEKPELIKEEIREEAKPPKQETPPVEGKEDTSSKERE